MLGTKEDVDLGAADAKEDIKGDGHCAPENGSQNTRYDMHAT